MRSTAFGVRPSRRLRPVSVTVPYHHFHGSLELLTGERPFRAERDTKLLMQQIRDADPPPPSQLNSQVPADLDTLCLKCLEKDPSRRFPTAAALAQELHRFLHGEPIHSRPITQWERARKWCQRNPAVASLSAPVAIVLLEGREMLSTIRGSSPFD